VLLQKSSNTGVIIILVQSAKITHISMGITLKSFFRGGKFPAKCEFFIDYQCITKKIKLIFRVIFVISALLHDPNPSVFSGCLIQQT
jgi:hypothetical protein